MMKSKSKRFSGMARLAVIPVLAILFLTLCREETVVLSSEEEQIPTTTVVEGPNESMAASYAPDYQPEKLLLVDEMRHFMAARLRYPQEISESGIMGRVDLYVSVGRDGIVRGITKRQPASGYIDIREIVVVGYSIPEVELVEHPGHPLLVAEGRRLVRSFPILDIPEVKGRIMKLSVNFIMQPGRAR